MKNASAGMIREKSYASASRRSPIVSAGGTRWTYETVFQAAILDARAEHDFYLSEGRKWKPRWTALQTYVLVAGFVWKHGLGKVFDFVRQVVTGISMGG